MASATQLPPKIQYVFRHVPPPKLTEAAPKREYLSGYGVGLDLKKMDYLALDDRRSGAGENNKGIVRKVLIPLSSAGTTNDVAEVSSEKAPRHDVIRDLLDALPVPKNGEAVNLTAPLTKEEFKCTSFCRDRLHY